MSNTQGVQLMSNAFLLEHEVYLVSDWAILNDTSSKQLQRIFSQFHHLTSQEIQQAMQLLGAIMLSIALNASKHVKQELKDVNPPRLNNYAKCKSACQLKPIGCAPKLYWHS
jgi:hypothetical protein